MSWEENNEKQFVNPYTFIPLIDECERKDFSQLESEKKMTGYIECELKTKTPIFIPNTTSEKALNNYAKERGKSYDFYSYIDLKESQSNNAPEPIIPGSEIRGVIRSMYETLTKSCMSTINEDELFHKRTTVPGKAGFFYKDNNGEWCIKDAKTYRINTGKKGAKCPKINNYNDFKEGDKVFFQAKGNCVTRISKTKESDDDKEGYIHKGEDFLRKKYETLFVENDNGITLEIGNNEEIFQRLKNLIDLYRENGKSKYNEFIVDKNQKMLIYYSKKKVNGKDVYYLSPAAISQEIFINNLGDILKNQGNFNPCSNKKQLCPACLLFGMVSKEDAFSSRLRFTDASLKQKSNISFATLYHNPSVLNELASPKTSATEFYLEISKKADLDLWNYDYAGNWKGYKFNDIDDYLPKIRGRKFYWHNKNWRKNVFDLNYEKLNNRNVMVRPLKKEITFSFKIYFDSITKAELKALIWTLHLGSNENDCYHKIGMGKPLGLGSIKIKVKEVKERKLCLNNGKVIRNFQLYNDLISENEIPQLISKEIYEYVKKVTSFNEAPENISYPIGKDAKNGEKVFLWFVGNRGNVRNPKIKNSLPLISDSNQSLPSFIEVKDEQSNRSKGKGNRRKNKKKD